MGYHTIPIAPKGKFPAWIRDGKWIHTLEWQKWRDEAPNEDDFTYWCTMPRANLGVVLGTRHGEHQLVAVDIDVTDPDEVAELVGTLPRTPMEKKGAKGTTLFFLASPEVRSRGYRTKTKVPLADLLTGNATKQTVMPPSVHPDGPIYKWVGDGPVPIGELPILTPEALDEFHEMLESLGWKEGAEATSDEHGNRAKIARSADFEDDPFAAVKVDALANLELWVHDLTIYGLESGAAGYRAVPDFRPSGSGRRTEDRKKSLSITPTGIRDHGDKGYSAIDLVMATEKLGEAAACAWLEERLYDDQAHEVQIIAGPSAKSDVYTTESDLDDDELIEEEHAGNDIPQFERIAPHDPSKPWTDLPTHSDPIMALGMYLKDGKEDGLNVFALTAALSLYSTAIGRLYTTPVQSGAVNLYFLGLAPSGTGKTRFIKRQEDVLISAGMESSLGPAEWTAGTVFENHVMRQPITLCLVDEFGDTMQRMTDPKASPAQQSRAKPIKEMYSVGFSTYRTSEMAQRRAEVINAPHVSFYAMSTPEKLYDNLTEGQLEEGFINRWMFVPSQAKPPSRDELRERFAAMDSGGNIAIPNYIVGILRHARQSRDPYGEETRFSHPSMLAQTSGGAVEPLIVDWEGDHVKTLWVDYAAHCASPETCTSEVIRNLYARAAENALRIATILAVSHIAMNRQKPTISFEDLQFAIRFVDWCVRANYENVSRGIGAGSKYAELQDKVLEYIRKKHRTHRETYNNFRNRVDGPRAMQDILTMLIESGLIMKNEQENSRGRPTPVYIARKVRKLDA